MLLCCFIVCRRPHNALFAENAVRHRFDAFGNFRRYANVTLHVAIEARWRDAEDFSGFALRPHPRTEVRDCLHAPSVAPNGTRCKYLVTCAAIPMGARHLELWHNACSAITKDLV